MYISGVRLLNWRSYEDAKFDFPAPTPGRQMVLIGAMNGHGKTSVLLAIYLGLFGRQATSFVQAFRDKQEQGEPYKKLMQAMRRRGDADYVSVEIVIRTTEEDGIDDVEEIRVARTWYYNSVMQLKDRNPEEVRIYIDNKMMKLNSSDPIEDAEEMIESALFPSHILPVFVFDGEQAQQRVLAAGDGMMRTAVNTLFGTDWLSRTDGTLADYLSWVRSRNNSDPIDNSSINKLKAGIKSFEEQIAYVRRAIVELEERREHHRQIYQEAERRLLHLGATQGTDLKHLGERRSDARVRDEREQERLSQAIHGLALPLALARVAPGILARLEGERHREEWEATRNSAVAREDLVMQRAFPVPDPLLDSLNPTLVTALQARMRQAIAAIYEPAPSECAPDYRFGHVRGQQRHACLARLEASVGKSTAQIREIAHEAREAREALAEAEQRFGRYQNIGEDLRRINETIKTEGANLREIDAKIATEQRRIPAMDAELLQLRVDLGRKEAALVKAAPIQRRIDLAQRIRAVIDPLRQELSSLVLSQIEGATTRHFREMADERYRPAEVRLSVPGNPLLILPGGQEQPVQSMSGFEQRTFGIAFSLGLAEITGFRAPLVIDTPVGNADSRYRLRMLKHLASTRLVDQVIILSHDEEVVSTYHDEIKRHVATHYLIRQQDGCSNVYPDAYFTPPVSA